MDVRSRTASLGLARPWGTIRRTLAFRILTAVVLSSCLLFLGNYFGNYRALEKSLSGNVRTTIAQTSQILNTAISAASNQQGGDLRTMEAFFKEVVDGAGKSGIVYVIVVTQDGTRALQAGASMDTLPQPDSPAQFESCAVRGICHVRDPILLQGADVGFLQYGLATQSFMDALTQAYANSLAITTLVTVLIFGAIALAGLAIARRAARLKVASNAIAMGNYAIRVKIDGTDELSDLSANFNRMADAIEANMAEISALKDGLEARVHERTQALNASNQLLAANVAQLGSAREQLVKSEKLASLGALVAGVSHELNTPIGNAMVAATTVRQAAVEFAALLAQDKVSRKALDVFLQTSVDGNALTERALRRAVDLISSFRSVAVDRTSERRRRFDLAETLQDVITTLCYLHKLTPQRIEVQVDPGITMDSFPGPLGQVLSNLIDNALTHAFDKTNQGSMRLRAHCVTPDSVRMEFSDNGRGIAPEHIARIFDPFFTTTLGQGGSGLGLNIANNIVEGLLGGFIHVESQLGLGTLFVVDLPLVAPA